MANLPADLPTNWTQGQIISPNGTEVGLSQQYGYNYLNEQVNNTQTEVNSLSTAQTSTQQQVNTLNTQVGNIQGQVTTQGQNITALQGTTASQGQSITSLQSQVSSNDTDISNLQSTTTTQGQSITTLQGQVSTLNQTTTSQGESITSLQSEVSAINTALDSVAQESSVQDIIDTIGTTTDSGATATTGTLMGKVNELIKRLISAYTVQSETLQEYVEESQTQYSGTSSYNGTQNHYHTIGLYYPKFNGTIKVKIEGNIINFPSRPFYVGIYYNSPNSSKFYATNTSITEFYAKGTYEAVTSGSDSVPAMKIQVSSPMPTGIFSTSFVITVQQGVPVSFIAVAGTANGDSYTFNINKIELCYDIKTAGVI